MRRRTGLRRGTLQLSGAILASVGFAVGAVGAGAGPAGGMARGGVLRLALSSDISSVDSALAYTPPAFAIENATCAKLFTYPDRPGAAGAEVVPEVVQRFTVSPDRRTYTFELKRSFRFSTGAPVNAASFQAALDRDADPAIYSAVRLYLHPIAGADAVLDGRARTISGVQVLAPYTLRIRLTQPLGDFPARLTMPGFCPVPPGTPADPHGLDDLPGSGPYYIAERVVDRRVVLRRNPYYRGDRPANVDRIELTIGLSPAECLAATEENRIDLCLGAGALPPDAHRGLADRYGINRPGGRYLVAPNLGTYFLAFNHDRPAFKGKGQAALAKAINYAIDRPALARALGYLAGRRSDRFLPPVQGRAGHLYPLVGADPKTARAWLAKAETKPKRLVFYTFNGPGGVTVAQVFAYDLRQLGIEVEVKYFDGKTLYDRASTRGEPFDVVFAVWLPDYADPASSFRVLLDGASLGATANTNLSYLDDPRVNAGIAAADRLTGAARRKAFADLDAAMMRDNPPMAVYLHSNERRFVSASVGCFFIHPVYGVDLAAMCKR